MIPYTFGHEELKKKKFFYLEISPVFEKIKILTFFSKTCVFFFIKISQTCQHTLIINVFIQKIQNSQSMSQETQQKNI